jgi:hypothetical protein
LNEPNLARRLEDLFDQTEGMADKIAGIPVKKFIRQVTDTRNYFTHWDASNAARALSDGALLHASSRLQALLEMLLLRDAGFSLSSQAVAAVLQRRISWLPH